MKNHGVFITRPRQYRALPYALGLMVVAFGLLLGRPSGALAASGAPSIDVNPLTTEVSPNGTLRYKIQIDNDTTANADLTRVDVTLRYDPNTLTLIDSRLRDNSDFVREVGDGKATVQFGTIDAGDDRSATLVFHVNAAVALGSPIQADASYHWWSEESSASGGIAIDTVSAASATSAATPAIAPTSGPAGTLFAIDALGFAPDEQVVTWLNTPARSQALSLTATTTASGAAYLAFDSTDLAPGAYSLVAHGLDSEHEAVVAFVVTAP